MTRRNSNNGKPFYERAVLLQGDNDDQDGSFSEDLTWGDEGYSKAVGDMHFLVDEGVVDHVVLTTDEVRTWLRVSLQDLRLLIARGLPVLGSGGFKRFNVADVSHWLYLARKN